MKLDKVALLIDLVVVFGVSAAFYKGFLPWPWAVIIFLQLLRAQIMGAHLAYLKNKLEMEKRWFSLVSYELLHAKLWPPAP